MIRAFVKKHLFSTVLVIALVVAFLAQGSPRSMAVADTYEEFVAVYNTDSQPPAIPKRHGTDPQGLLKHANEEAVLLLDVLRAADGDISCNLDAGNPQDECIVNTDFQSMTEVALVRCERLDPSALRHAPAFDQKLHGRTVGALESTCNRLSAAQRSHGKPRTTLEWKAVVKAAKADIEKAGVK